MRTSGKWKTLPRAGVSGLATVICLGLLASCSKGSGPEGQGRRFLKLGTAPVGATFYTMGAGIAKLLSEHLPGTTVTAEATAGSGENVRLMDRRRIEMAIASSPITFHAARGLKPWPKKYDARAVITLYQNVSQFIALAGSGIKRIPDMKKKRVAVGPAGSGFEHYHEPLLAMYGMSYADFEPIYQGQADAAELLTDGRIDVAFFTGGIPHPSLLMVATNHAVEFVRVEPETLRSLTERYPYYHMRNVPAGTYKGWQEDVPVLVVGSAQLVVRPDTDEQLAYQLAKIIYERRDELAAIHPTAKEITAPTAVVHEGLPYHPGAIRYFKEVGIWKEPPDLGRPAN